MWLVMIATVSVGCATSGPLEGIVKTGRYAKGNLMVDGGKISSSNYRSGHVLPLGTRVEVLNSESDRIELHVADSGENVAFVLGWSPGKDILGAFDDYFGVDDPRYLLARLTPMERQQVASAAVAPGMSRDAVLLSLGRPPASQVRVLSTKRWCYARSSTKLFCVVFGTDDLVARIEDAQG
jgi:hypothetical protein